VHCGHDDVYCALDTGWNITFAVDAQQAADQALILRRVNELALTPGINAMDGFLTSHLERTFRRHEADLIREFLGRADDMIDCPTPAQRELFGPQRRRVPQAFDLKNPALLGSVQNQEHYMGGIAARRHHFIEPILGFFTEAYEEFGRLTGRHYGLVSEYNNDAADTAFVCLGSAAENCHAAVDYLQKEHGETVGVVHINVLRPFPEAAVLAALGGKSRIIVLERSDDQGAGDGPLARDIRTALTKALANRDGSQYPGIPALPQAEMPRIFSGVYGLGSRDFRPEGILGAWEFATGRGARQDGETADTASFFYVGINHPYNVQSEETPSLLPDHTVAVRLHSIGGWGMITTGKNLGAIIGEIATYLHDRDHADDPDFEALHISANPKYGSEKKGAPTNYFLAVAPERIRVNCDLHHVDVVLCCDPKIFTHTDPLAGLSPGGAFVWESAECDEHVWERIPQRFRRWMIDNDIHLYVLDGFNVAREATDRADLQLRMQGNSFLGAFFKVSSFLGDNNVPADTFQEIVRQQYESKFGKFGDEVVASNMKVMIDGFERVRAVPLGDIDAEDTSTMRGTVVLPQQRDNSGDSPASPDYRPPLMSIERYDAEYRSDWGYNQPSTPHAATGVIAAATGATTSKYVARRQTPLFIAENCTQCMDCITACPDTALPNVAQDVSTVLATAIASYVADDAVRERLLGHVPTIEAGAREQMRTEANKKKGDTPRAFHEIVVDQLEHVTREDNWFAGYAEAPAAIASLSGAVEQLPFAYANVNAIFRTREKREEGSGGVFGIFVSDQCKGCAECVTECGDHNALVMVEESEDVNGLHETGSAFLEVLADTPAEYLGLYDPDAPLDSKPAALKNHLMQRDMYRALVSGDGACAGCGEKTVLRAVTSATEAYMRRIYHHKAERLEALAQELETHGLERLTDLASRDGDTHGWLQRTVRHLLLGQGGEDDADTDARMAAHGDSADAELVDALIAVLRQDAFNHRDLQAVDGGPHNGMSVMAMTANTGCNTVYGSTHPNSPHPYPWMNSLFQDGATTGWLVSESFIYDHVRRSVVPERIARVLLDGTAMTRDDYWGLVHMSDADLTADEVDELPRVWVVGGDGGLGDIGFQNLSKAMLQNRPNVQVVLLDTQVYSNTGGQNSDSSPMPGGGDMNQFGAASEGKLTEKKGVAEIMISGHGSPFVAQVSMANAANLYSAVLRALSYRGTGLLQCYTTCQPEHGVGDDQATVQATLIRDSRGMPEFVFDPAGGESYDEALSLGANRTPERDWWNKRARGGDHYDFTVAHWARTEARFRRHFFPVKEEETAVMETLDHALLRVTQQDVVHRNHLLPDHRAFLPKRGVYTLMEKADGTLAPVGLSRQMVLFCIERRKSWRLLQSKAGIVNHDRLAQERVLRAVDAGEILADTFAARLTDLIDCARQASMSGDTSTPLADLLAALDTVH
jgi:pyruvate-ferredoxin/flavodoxin oxidoreductase